MARSMLLSDALDEYRAHRASLGYAKETLRNADTVLRRMLAHVGNILVKNIRPGHMTQFFTVRSGEIQASTLAHEESVIKAFFVFLEKRRLLGPDGSPVADRRRTKVMPRTRQRIPATEFPRMLDLATHPTDRMIFALGIYLLLRQSEIKRLKVGDVHLATGYITVRIEKTKEVDEMPISSELDEELRRWLTAYSQTVGRVLTPDDVLVPAKTRPMLNGKLRGPMSLQSHKPVGHPHEAVKRIMVAAGYPIRDDKTGRSLSEGVHTLRRSAARAIFDRLVDDSYDGAIRTVQAMLHHSNTAQTERYIGLTLDVQKRDTLFRGKALFPSNEERSNVVSLTKVGS